jgi:MFS family permease
VTVPVPVGLQRRTIRVLVVSQVLGGLGFGAGVAVVGLMAYELSGTEALSGVSATASTVGSAAAALLIARIAAGRGRRPGLVTGYAIGALGAVLAILAAVAGSFPLHVGASFAFGWGSAANLYARYAATDLAPAERRASALSTVVWATTVGAVLGPNLTGPGEAVADLAGLPALAGPYLFSMVAFATAALVQLVLLRPDPLVTARAAVEQPTTPSSSSVRAAAATIRRDDAATAALAAITAAHAVMVGVMVMTPVHMEQHGASLQLVGLTISLHIAGMYALSPVAGRLADRFGRRPVLLLGLGQQAIAALLAAFGAADGSVAFAAGLILLGTGWSCCLVAGSTLLTDAVAVDERPVVQGVSDLAMNLAGALGGTAAGIVLAVAGYRALALSSVVLLLLPAWRVRSLGREVPAAPRVPTA